MKWSFFVLRNFRACIRHVLRLITVSPALLFFMYLVCFFFWLNPFCIRKLQQWYQATSVSRQAGWDFAFFFLWEISENMVSLVSPLTDGELTTMLTVTLTANECKYTVNEFSLIMNLNSSSSEHLSVWVYWLSVIFIKVQRICTNFKHRCYEYGPCIMSYSFFFPPFWMNFEFFNEFFIPHSILFKCIFIF